MVLGQDDEDVVTQFPQAQNFLRDAFAQGKFIGHSVAAKLFAASGLAESMDDGCFDLGMVDDGETIAKFVASCSGLRHWTRNGLA